MGEFQSNLHTATQLATKMRNASDRMQSATSRTINKTTRTTLSVNFKAQEANQQNLHITKQFCAAFQQTIDNIHSVVNEFEKMDNGLQKTFQ
ncbi:TIGR04197 family type VII secretion effector [Bacillus sp. RIT 809]|uniref:TIGR04197 family type VII secretion effector n=1 Tax=Bacillus sp. RIT 809 TaxID=2803857 RepID=UPI0019512949|nr:TIGR04197 family type VII secretion effector [Bacillus sp. RIT 809]MBM6648310.1 TIGR04197 family type VII secretion effector [Bacillus sp. RIT 809]